MAVVRTYVARSEEDLQDIDLWVEEASFEPRTIRFDEEKAILAVPLEQEEAIRGLPPEAPGYGTDDYVAEDLGLPQPELMRVAKSFAEYRVAIFRCQLLISAVERAKVSGRRLDRTQMLGHIEYDSERRAVAVSVLGRGKIKASVAQLDVALIVTDEVAGYYRRRYYSWGASTRPLS